MNAEPPSAWRTLIILRAEWALFAAVLLIAVVLRAIGLSEQAITPDEYGTYYFESDIGLQEYMALNKFRAPDNLPVYPVSLFLWLKVFGHTALNARLFSLIAGLLACAVIWRLGRGLGGRTVGLAAAFFYALSPLGVFEDQAIRPYSLFMLLALLSVLCVVRLTEHGPRTSLLVASMVINVLLVYTHLVSAILLLVEGIYLCCLWRLQFRYVIAWAIPQLCLVLPAPLLLTIPSTDPYYPPMHFTRYIENVFNLDTVDYSVEIIASRDNWGHRYLGYEVFRAATQAATLLLGLLAMGGVMRALYWARKRVCRWEVAALIVMVMFLPGLLIYIASQIVDPMSLPRYTIYTNGARFLLAAFAIAWIPWQWARLGAVAAVTAVLVGQISALLPHGARSEYNRASAVINSQAAATDIILTARYPDVLYIHLDINVNLDRVVNAFFQRQLKTNLPVLPEHSCYGLAETAAVELKNSEPVARSVWLVVMREFDAGPMPQLENELTHRGLAFESHVYYAFEGLNLYRVFKPVEPVSESIIESSSIDAISVLQGWGVAPPTGMSAEELQRIFLMTFDGPPENLTLAAQYTALGFILGHRDAALGMAVLQRGVELFPEDGALHFATGVLGLLSCDIDKAAHSFQRARELLSPAALAAVGDTIDAILQRDYAKARGLVERLQAISGGLLEPLVHDSLIAAEKCATPAS